MARTYELKIGRKKYQVIYTRMERRGRTYRVAQDVATGRFVQFKRAGK